MDWPVDERKKASSEDEVLVEEVESGWERGKSRSRG